MSLRDFQIYLATQYVSPTTGSPLSAGASSDYPSRLRRIERLTGQPVEGASPDSLRTLADHIGDDRAVADTLGPKGVTDTRVALRRYADYLSLSPRSRSGDEGALRTHDAEAIVVDPEELAARASALVRAGPVVRPVGQAVPKKRAASTTVFERDPLVSAFVLQAADGSCEACGASAPFQRADGSPFLEIHHLKRLADGGSDTVENAVALCPNCHRRLHHSVDRVAYREQVIAKVARLRSE